MADEQLGIFALQLLAALLANGQDLHRLAARDQLTDDPACFLDDIGVEAAAQAALGGHHDDKMGVVLARSGEQLRSACAVAHGAGEVGHHGRHALGIGTGRRSGFLRTLQLGGSNHLHRLGDLPRGFHAVDPVFQILEAGHRSAPDSVVGLRRRPW